MEADTANEIMFNIQSELELNVDERQLWNMIVEENDAYVLRAYGKKLRFDKNDGSLISDD